MKIIFLSKGLKSVPTPKNVNKSKIKEEIELHYKKIPKEPDISLFQKKSNINPNSCT